jgi:hypothetical protein
MITPYVSFLIAHQAISSFPLISLHQQCIPSAAPAFINASFIHFQYDQRNFPAIAKLPRIGNLKDQPRSAESIVHRSLYARSLAAQ